MADSHDTLATLVDKPQAGFWGAASAGVSATMKCRVVRNGDVAKDGYIPRATLPLRWLSPKEVQTAWVDVGDAILVSSGAYTGNVGRVVGPDDGLPVVASNFVRRLRPTEGVDPRWLFHLLRSHVVQRYVWPHTGGSAIPNLGSSFYRGCRVSFVPPRPEQRSIAEILDNVDEAIRTTEKLIAKLQLIKRGLLHDLLACGVDENGELRNHGLHPEQFNDGPLGVLPAKWRVATLGDVVRECGGFIQTGPFGSQLHAHEYVTDGVPVVMPQDIDGDHFNDARISRITERRATDLRRHRLRRNDTVFARRGDLSRCAPVSAREEGWLCGTGCLMVRIPHGALTGDWLAAVYRHDLGQRQVIARAVGSTMVNLNTAILSSLTIPIPPAKEQRDVIKRVNELKNRTHSEEGLLRKLHAIKSGLSDDLVTGRVRVNQLFEGDAA